MMPIRSMGLKGYVEGAKCPPKSYASAVGQPRAGVHPDLWGPTQPHPENRVDGVRGVIGRIQPKSVSIPPQMQASVEDSGEITTPQLDHETLLTPPLASASTPGIQSQRIVLPNIVGETHIGYLNPQEENDDAFAINIPMGNCQWDVMWDGIGSVGYGKEIAEIFQEALAELANFSYKPTPRQAITYLRDHFKGSLFFQRQLEQQLQLVTEKKQKYPKLPGAALTLVSTQKVGHQYEVEIFSVGDVEVCAVSSDSKHILGVSKNHALFPTYLDPQANQLVDAIGASYFDRDENPGYVKLNLPEKSFLLLGTDGIFSQFPALTALSNIRIGTLIQTLRYHGATTVEEIHRAIFNESRLRMRLADLSAAGERQITTEWYEEVYRSIWGVQPNPKLNWWYLNDTIGSHVVKHQGVDYPMPGVVFREVRMPLARRLPIARFHSDNLTLMVRRLV